MKPILLALLSLGVAANCFSAEPNPLTAPLAAEKPLYLNPNASLDERVNDLVGRMTLEEKAQALDHRGPDLQRFGLRSDKWNQCLNGVQWSEPATLFPVCIALGATWDPALVQESATVFSDEARAIYNGWKQNPEVKSQHKGLIYRAPVINISRNPYWGRIHEVYSEDPFLTGRMAVAYVQGLQGNDPHYLKIAATLKHFAVNNVEAGRTGLDAKVPERWLREYWLPHWREAVVEAKVCSLMASYNAINGTPDVTNHWLLTDVLKNEWKHEGFVVSDLGGVHTMVSDFKDKKMAFEDAVAASVTAGCDFSDKEFRENIPAAVKDGKLSEDRLNDAVKRVMRVRLRLGEFDPQERLPWHNLKPEIIDSPEHRTVALRAAREAMVLLKNENNTLPLDPLKLKRVAVIGPCANIVQKNNYNGKSTGSIPALMGIQSEFKGEVAYAVGGKINSQQPKQVEVAPPLSLDPAGDLAKAVEAARNADVALVFVGTDASIEQEGNDRKTLGLPGNQEELVEAVYAANPRTVVIQMSAGPLTTPWIKQHVPAIIQAWWPGGQGGTAIADVLFGKINPAGRLPYTVYASEAQVPPQNEYDISKGFTYQFVKGAPLWPFGHGLSYTSFDYSGLKTNLQGGKIAAEVTVENTGKHDGDEVVQLYVKALHSHVVRPAKQLRGFKRVALKQGEKQTVQFVVPVKELAYWDENLHGFVIELGDYELQVGGSSADIRQSVRIPISELEAKAPAVK